MTPKEFFDIVKDRKIQWITAEGEVWAEIIITNMDEYGYMTCSGDKHWFMIDGFEDKGNGYWKLVEEEEFITGEDFKQKLKELEERMAQKLEETDRVIKNDVKDGKLNNIFIHPAVQYQEGLAFMYGQSKYGDGWNYMRSSGHKASQLVAAAKRHIDKYFYQREEFDKEASDHMECKVHHLANAKSCLTMLLAEIIEGTLDDDRPESLKTPTTKEEMDNIFSSVGDEERNKQGEEL